MSSLLFAPADALIDKAKTFDNITRSLGDAGVTQSFTEQSGVVNLNMHSAAQRPHKGRDF